VPRELAFRLTSNDFVMETFRTGGHGGQNRDKRNTGVRYRHEPSGAVGECREHRHQNQNRKIAFTRMAESREFQQWARERALSIPPVGEVVRQMMEEPDALKVEVRRDGKWVEST
jgi:protein subunit release factor B